MNPLWLPKGSVHALLAFAVVLPVMFMVVDGRVVPEWMQLAFAGALAGYSVYRHASPTPDDPPKPLADLDAVDQLQRATVELKRRGLQQREKP